MDGVSVAASIVGIATAGVAISIKLVTLATQISTASERVSSIGNDISLTSGVLHQLGELMTQKTTNDGISIFSQGGLETTKTSAAMCERIFSEVDRELVKASEQLRGCKRLSGGKIRLSRSEKAKWPFLQPGIEVLRADLREAKGTLMLMLQVTSLALSKRMADRDLVTQSENSIEQRDFMRAIVALHAQQHPGEGRLIGASSAGTKGGGPPASTVRTERRGPYGSSSGDETSITCVQSQASPSQERSNSSKRSARSTKERKDQSSQQPSVSRYSSVDTLDNPDWNIHQKSPVIALHTSSFPISGGGIDNTARSERSSDLNKPPQEAGSSERKRAPSPEASKDLSLFLLKPIVKDFFDKIELSWTVQDTKMQGPVIRKHMDKNEEEGIPSVIDMLEQLREHENAMVNAELAATSSSPAASLLLLKRTKTDMRHRDILLKDVPGLQFVVGRQVAPAARLPVDAPTLTPMYSETDGTVNSAFPNEPSKLRPVTRRLAPPGRCRSCNTAETPEWRRGPDGARTLCNACGLHYAKLTHEMKTKGPPQVEQWKRIPENEREAKPEGPFAGLEGCIVVKDGTVEDRLGNTVGRIVEGDSKRLVGLAVDEDGDVIDRWGNVRGHAKIITDHDEGQSEGQKPSENVPENVREAKPEGPFARLEGCVVVKDGMVEDEDGNIVGSVVEGNIKRIIGLSVDEDGDVIDRFGNVRGHAKMVTDHELVESEGRESEEIVPEKAREAHPDAPFAGLEGYVVVKDGMVDDEDGNTVGSVIKVFYHDARKLVGLAVDGDGDILDRHGNVVGHAERYEEPEAEVADLSSLDNKVVAETGNIVDEQGTVFGRIAEGDLAKLVGRKVDSEGYIWNDNKKIIGRAELLPGGTPSTALDDRSQSAEDVSVSPDESHGIPTDGLTPQAIAEIDEQSSTRPDWADDDEPLPEEDFSLQPISNTLDQSMAQSPASAPGTPLPEEDKERWDPEAEEFENRLLGIDGSDVADQSMFQSPASAPATPPAEIYHEIEQDDAENLKIQTPMHVQAASRNIIDRRGSVRGYAERLYQPEADEADSSLPVGKLIARKRTKTGCFTCRKRRIKCGEERPTCKNCVKSKRECDGYIPRVIFKDPLGTVNDRLQTAADGVARDENHGITTDKNYPLSFAESYGPSSRRPDRADEDEGLAEEAGMNASIFADHHEAQSAGIPPTEMDYEDEFENRIRPENVTPPPTIPDEKRKRNATASHRFRERRKEKEREAREASDKISKLEQQVQSLLKLESQDPPGAYDELHSDAESIESHVGEDDMPGKDEEDPVVADLLVDLLERYTTLYERKGTS